MGRRTRKGAGFFGNLAAEAKARLPGADKREAEARAREAALPRGSMPLAPRASSGVGALVAKQETATQYRKELEEEDAECERLGAALDASRNRITGRPHGLQGQDALRALKEAGCVQDGARRKSRKLGNKFNRCVKSVRQTVRARPKSTKESAAIAICTKSVLQTRGRTMKRYRKGRLITQKKFRGGNGRCS